MTMLGCGPCNAQIIDMKLGRRCPGLAQTFFVLATDDTEGS